MLILFLVQGLLYIIRKYCRGFQFTDPIKTGKICIITGAAQDAGRELCEDLNKIGAKVYMIGKEEKAVAETRKQLIEKGCDGDRLIALFADYSNLESIRLVTRELQKAERAFDILINAYSEAPSDEFQKTDDGFERTWQTNYLGHYLFTTGLSAHFSPSARIVNITNDCHFEADSVEDEVVEDPVRYTPEMAVARAMLAKVMYTKFLNWEAAIYRFHERRINSCHVPVETKHKEDKEDQSPLASVKAFFRRIFFFILPTPKDGIQTALYLALSNELEGNGLFYRDGKVSKVSPKAWEHEPCQALCTRNYDQCGKWLDICQ